MKGCLGLSRLVPFMFAMALSAFPAFADEIIFTFPEAGATPSEICGQCHAAIYREYVAGVGSDTHASHSTALTGRAPLPANVSSSATAHASTGFPTAGVKGDKIAYCNSCHFPVAFTIPSLDAAGKNAPQEGSHAKGGLTCAGCHLTPEGKIRAVHAVRSPHSTVRDPGLQGSALCANCHGYYDTGKRVVGKQMQTFLEWKEDYFDSGVGKQQCQECHMPRTLRQTAEDFNEVYIPPRAVARHLWTGANSLQRHQGSLSLTIVREQEGTRKVDFHVSNIGAGHSVPTGMNCRAVYLRAEVLDKNGNRIASNQWLFAPYQGDRPDDRAFLEEDKKLGEKGAAAMQADAQGPHEASIRAGEERVLSWEPSLQPGQYTVKARLVYSLNRFKDEGKEDGRVLASESLEIQAQR